MRNKFLGVVGLAVGLVALALPVSANHIILDRIAVDCEQFSAAVSGRVSGSVRDQVVIGYSFVLSSEGQVVEEVSGLIDDLPAPDGSFFDFSRQISGSWSGELCGNYTVEGMIALLNSVTMQPLTPSAGEVTVLDRAREALRAGDSAGAMRALDEHGKRFADGTLGEEAELLRIEALLERGERRAAAAEARRFLAAHPQSSHRARVRSLLRRARASSTPNVAAFPEER